MDSVLRQVLESWLTNLLFITAIIELILSATWNPYYFRHGLPIFRRMYSVVSTFPKPSTQELEAQFRGQFRHPILFRKLSPSEYAFRYSFFHFGLSATPLMHGMLRWDDTSGLVSVTGYANWFPTCFVLLVAFVWSGLDHVFLLFTIIIVALSFFYLFQSKRFNKVGELASQAWQNHPPKAAG